VTPPGGAPIHRAGYTLTILRKTPAGKWVLVRDANLMTKTD
jgi:ketosteroid isomerase-like protein